MCMSFAVINNFPTKEYAWKVMSYNFNDDKWQTPYKRQQPLRNKLKALGRIDLDGEVDGLMSLSGGAIHCYRTKEQALIIVKRYYGRAVFKVKGKNPVAWNSSQIAFEEIEFVDTINDWEM